MKKIDLLQIENNRKIGDVCEYIEPNVTEDCIFYVDGEAIGFYMTKMPEKMCKLADLANAEFNAKGVPKAEMSRGPQGSKKDKIERAKAGINLVTQMSCILGSVAPKPHMRRPYPTRSSVHSVKSANTFIKAMLLLAKESENLIKEIIPNQYEHPTCHRPLLLIPQHYM